jgi:asparagine synthetase B (glutamine-hydrolysing)
VSWILGVIGSKNITQEISHLKKIHPQHHFQHETSVVYLAAGGISETCFYGSFAVSTEHDFHHWLVVGVGIQKQNLCCRFLKLKQWHDILSAPKPDLTRLDGHFVALRWNDKLIECYTDQFGLRTLFFARTKNCVALSTRSDWLARFTGRNEINFEQFGSHWLTFNQFSHESLIRDLSRLGPNGTAICTADSISLRHTPWLPDGLRRSKQDAIELLQSFSNPDLPLDKKLAFGLSGGLDSRVLLAVMQSSRRQPFSLFLFGHPHEPDVRIAQEIAAAEGIDQEFFSELLPFPDDVINRLVEYEGEMQLVSPMSLWLKLRFYSELHQKNNVIIDGGFGEIARRQFMNRALIRARSLLMQGQTAQLFPYIATHRASIFNQEIEREMQKGVATQLARVWQEMPSIADIGAETFADLLVVRYRYANYAGAGQASMDNEIVSYMPFIQPSYVNAAFGLPLNEKRNGRFYREILRTQRPGLTRHVLVKGTTTYPFWMTTLPAWLWTKVKSKFGSEFVDPLPTILLHHLREFVLDTVESERVRTYSPYDYGAIKSRIDQFYSGRTSLARDVEWWLSFELWRRALQK